MHAGVRAWLDAATGPGAVIDPMGRILHVNAALVALGGWPAAELLGRAWPLVFGGPGAGPADEAAGRPAAGWSGTPDERIRLRDGTLRAVRWAALPLLDARATTVATAFLGHDLAEHEARDGELALLAAVAAQASESVMIADAARRITYVNAAFERATGYAAAEVLGQNPRLLQSGHQSPAFYRFMWWKLDHGRPWRGELVNRHRDGSLIVEEAVIAPVQARDGSLAGYVAVKRDVTRLRQLRASLDDVERQRAVLADALARVAAQDTLDGACGELSAILCELPTTVAAAVMLLDEDDVTGRVVGLRSTSPLALPAEVDFTDTIRRLHEDAAEASWIEPLAPIDPDPSVVAARDAGVQALLVVPLRHNGLPFGAMLVGGADPAGSDLVPSIPSVLQVATVARSVLAPKVALGVVGRQFRRWLQEAIADRAFRTVFQPVVDLFTGGIVGFEALTRFDGRPSTQGVFEEAARLGMAEQLELATMTAAIEEAKGLPAGAVLCVNVGPGVLVDHAETIRTLLMGDRDVILEVTEHALVDDYDALAETVGRLRPAIRLAVDDVGSGAANLHHLVRLAPDFVKLDLSLVRGIDADLTRQALVVGLREFARVSGRSLIAEGIETELERTTLTELSVRFGQGYLLGAPAAVEAWRHVGIGDPGAFGRASTVRDQAPAR
jgi:PAS domain S-box-containing protein